MRHQSSAKRFVSRATVGVLLVTGLGLVTAPPGAAAATNAAEDTFVRPDTSAGWQTTTNGDAVSNLPWQGDFASNPLTVISGNVGTVKVTSSGHPLSGWLGVPQQVGGEALGEVVFSAAGHGAAGLLLQRSGNSQWYEMVLDTSVGKLELARRFAGVTTVVGTPMTFAASAGTKYWLRLDVQPAGATEVLSARAWPDGTAEPGSWQTTYTDATALSAGYPGALGIWFKGPGPGDHIDFHAFAYAPSGLASAPTAPSAAAFTADSPPTSGTVGSAYAGYAFAASGAPAPTFTVASGTLPPGLTLNTTSGALSGTPTASGPFTFTVQAANGVGAAAVSPSLTITVSAAVLAAPQITSGSSASTPTQTPLSFAVTTTGTPTAALSVSGALPTGISFIDHANGTGTLGGTAAAGTEGTYPLTVTASNGVSPDASQAFTLSVTGLPPAFTADTPPGAATVAKPYPGYSFAATGDPAPAFTVASGSLPPGLTLDPSSGALTGTPTSAGGYPFTVQAANGVSPAAITPQITVTVSDVSAPQITSASSTSVPALSALNFPVTTTGAPAPAISLTGPVPGWLTLTDHGGGAATISGTPPAGSEGSFALTVNASNGVSPDAAQSFTLTVTGLAPTFTADAPPNTGKVGTAYSYTFAASADPAPSYTVGTGSLPAGLTLNPTSGLLSGSPTAVGSSTFTVQATNGVSPDALSPALSIVISPAGPTVAISVLGGALGTPASTLGVTPGTLVPVSGGPPGTRMILSGTGFQPGELVQPVWYNGTQAIPQKSFYELQPIQTAKANGTVLEDFFVPDIYGGNHTVALTGLTSHLSVSTTFTVTQRLDTGATTAPASTTLPLAGWGFAAKETVTVSWNGTAVLSAVTDTKGAFSKPYSIPSGTPPGAYTVLAKGSTSGFATTDSVTVGAPSTGPGPGPTDWATFGFDPQQHRVNPTETTIGTGNVGTLGTHWTRQVFAPDKVTGAIYEANGVAYVGTVHGVIYALDPHTGAIVWMYQSYGSVYESPTLANGLVYFSTVNNSNEGVVGNYAFALDARNGALIWARALPNGSGWDSPTVVGSRVIVEEANKEAVSGGEIAFDALTGVTDWSFATPYGIWAPGTVDPSGTTLYQDTGNPCSSTGVPGDGCSGSLLAVNIATGTYTVLDHFPDVSGDDDVPTAPAYDNGNLYIGSKNGYEYSVRASDGHINWSYNTGSAGDLGIFSSAIVANNEVIFGGGDRLMHALNETTGALLWTQSIGGGLIYSSPVLANGVVYIESMSPNGKTNLAGIDPANGNILWSSSMSYFGENPPTICNGILFAGDDAGALYAFTPGGT